MGKKENKIELRSEKMRNIIGKIPSNLIRWGSFVIVLIFFELLLACTFFRFPDKQGEQKTLMERVVQKFTAESQRS